MIRRLLGADRWVLISQVEHARLSGELAEAWGNERFTALAPHDEMVAAITHHDDGWSDWEVAPKVDPQTGRPLDFTETPLVDSLAIWRESIGRAADFGPLAGYTVSGHFCALLERFSSRWKSDAAHERLALGFLDDERKQRETWLDHCQSSSTTASRTAADQAVVWLQMFDCISLWLCCAERDKNETFHPPSGDAITLQPTRGPYDIEVTPWPFREDAIALQAVGRAIAAMQYASSSDLVTAPAQSATLKWSFTPGS